MYSLYVVSQLPNDRNKTITILFEIRTIQIWNKFEITIVIIIMINNVIGLIIAVIVFWLCLLVTY